MGIDTAFLDRLIAIGRDEKVLPDGTTLILGDCKFYTSWASGDNAADRLHFQRSYGFSRVETVDMVGAPTITADLQQPISGGLRDQFDMIVDAGTLFWCFDVAAVLKNCFEMLRDRGIMVHLTALTGHFGRGYYNMHPTFFRDVYAQNGFEIITIEVRVHKQLSRVAKLQRKLWELRKNPVGNFKRIAENATYLRYANFVDMDFTSEVAVAAPMLPNDALILCAARRRRRQEFVRAVPSFAG